MPNIRICEKCQYWCEYFGLYTENRTATLWMGCTLPEGLYSETKFLGEKYALIKNGIRGNVIRKKGKAPSGCYNGSPMFKGISELVKDEYDDLRKEVEEAIVVEECPYLAEQKIEEWNK